MILKTSSLCAGVSLLVLGGFMAVNLAGCGGGGGGIGTTSPTPSTVTASFRPLLADGSSAPGGTVTLTAGGKTVSQSISGGLADFAGLAPGFYAVNVSITNAAGNAVLDSIFITSYEVKSGVSSYVLQNTSGTLKVTGKMFLNPNSSDLANRSIAACDTRQVPLTAAVRISIRQLSTSAGNTIISQTVRPLQGAGTPAADLGKYSINVPSLPRPYTFQVEVSQADSSGAIFAGVRGPVTFVTEASEVPNVDVCANDNAVVPGPRPTPTLTEPTPTPTGTRRS